MQVDVCFLFLDGILMLPTIKESPARKLNLVSSLGVQQLGDIERLHESLGRRLNFFPNKKHIRLAECVLVLI